MANSFNDILGQSPRTTLSLVLVLMMKDKKARETPKVLSGWERALATRSELSGENRRS